MVHSGEEVNVEDLILQVFEDDEVLYFPITSQKEARSFVKALHTKGVAYDMMCQELGEHEPNFSSWRKSLGRQGVGHRVIEWINRPLNELLEDSEDEEETTENGVYRHIEEHAANHRHNEDELTRQKEQDTKEALQQQQEIDKVQKMQATEKEEQEQKDREKRIQLEKEREQQLQYEEQMRQDRLKEKQRRKEEQEREQQSELKRIQMERLQKQEEQERLAKAKEVEELEVTKAIANDLEVTNDLNGNRHNDGAVSEELIECSSTGREISPRNSLSEGQTAKDPEKLRSQYVASKQDDQEMENPDHVDENYNSDLDPDNADQSPVLAKLVKKISTMKSTHKNSAGYVYVLSDTADAAQHKRIKVGISRCPEKRLQQARLFNPDINLACSFVVNQRISAITEIYHELEQYRMSPENQHWFIGPYGTMRTIIGDITAKFPSKSIGEQGSPESHC